MLISSEYVWGCLLEIKSTDAETGEPLEQVVTPPPTAQVQVKFNEAGGEMLTICSVPSVGP